MKKSFLDTLENLEKYESIFKSIEDFWKHFRSVPENSLELAEKAACEILFTLHGDKQSIKKAIEKHYMNRNNS